MMFIVEFPHGPVVTPAHNVAAACTACRAMGGTPVVRPATEAETAQAQATLEEIRQTISDTRRRGILA